MMTDIIITFLCVSEATVLLVQIVVRIIAGTI